MGLLKRYILQGRPVHGEPRAAKAGMLSLLCWAVLCGCGRSAPTPAFVLTRQAESDRGVWWSARPAGDDGRAMVMGIEQRVSGSQVRLWLIDTRGLRIFDIHNRRLTGWSAPLATDDPVGDFEIIRSLARGKLGFPAGSGWPGPPLPVEDVNRMDGLGDLESLLKRIWPESRVEPPGDTTGRRIHQALGEGDLSIDDLLQYGM